MADPHSHDERQKYEDELYKDDSEVDNEGASDSENGGDEEALSHINYSHSFRLENEGDEEAEEEEASVSGDIIPPDLLSHVPSWTETEVVMISEENMEGPGVSSISSKKRREKKSPEDVDLEVKVMRMRSPSADDNPNLDEGSLEVRGKGRSRYFAEAGGRGFCRMCRHSGHTSRFCPEKETNCYLCKADHDPLRCPMSKLCFKCMQRGHIYAECPNARDNTRCGFCNDGNGHHPMQCPQQWRQFVFLPYSGDKERDQLTIYCYNCGDGGHMGDECRHRPIHGSTGISSFTALAFNHKFPDRRRGVTYTPARRESPSGGGPIEIYSDNEDNEPMPVPGVPRHTKFTDSPSRSRSPVPSRPPARAATKKYKSAKGQARSKEWKKRAPRPSRSPSPVRQGQSRGRAASAVKPKKARGSSHSQNPQQWNQGNRTGGKAKKTGGKQSIHPEETSNNKRRRNANQNANANASASSPPARGRSTRRKKSRPS